MDLSNMGFDFDEMVRLAKDDPDAFARHREQLLRHEINDSSRREILSEVQARVDAARYSVSPGRQSGEKLHVMMLEDVVRLKGLVARLNNLLEFENCRGEGCDGSIATCNCASDHGGGK